MAAARQARVGPTGYGVKLLEAPGGTPNQVDVPVGFSDANVRFHGQLLPGVRVAFYLVGVREIVGIGTVLGVAPPTPPVNRDYPHERVVRLVAPVVSPGLARAAVGLANWRPRPGETLKWLTVSEWQVLEAAFLAHLGGARAARAPHGPGPAASASIP